MRASVTHPPIQVAESLSHFLSRAHSERTASYRARRFGTQQLVRHQKSPELGHNWTKLGFMHTANYPVVLPQG
jgi:hypothetical protein